MKTGTNKTNETHHCGKCVHSRRAFLTDCVKYFGAVGAFSGLIIPAVHAGENARSMKIRVVFVLQAPVQTRADWPNIGYDFNPAMTEIMNALKNGCPGIEFVQSMAARANNAEEIRNTDQTGGNIDGYIVVQMNTGPQGVVQQFVSSGKPVLYADFLFGGSGRFLISTSYLLRDGAENFAHISSNSVAHLVAAANCFPLSMGPGGVRAFVDGVTQVRKYIVADVKVDMECIEDKIDILSTENLLRELRTKKILEFEKGWADVGQQTKEIFGIEIIRRPYTELNGLWEKADREQAMEIVKRWKSSAAAIVDVSDETLEKSARMYLAMKQCLKDHDACAITIDCLTAFYGGHTQAYPCLGFYELLNEGLIGACECDTLSTLTMVIMTTLTKGRPGLISDPVMDVAKKQIIYAHCVSSNKPFGPQGASNPYTIMTHSEDRQGASLRSTLPAGYMTTTLEFDPRSKQILFHQAKAVGNSIEDRACRTKLVTVPVGDYEKLYTYWDYPWHWHRVTYYGDLRKPVFALADRLGWKVIEEA